MTRRLDGKVALVTGGASRPGIGFAIAKRLAEEGAQVILSDVDKAGVEESAALISQANHAAKAVPHDVASQADWDRVISDLLAEFGRLRATELGVDAVLKATKVDGVYTADPKLDPTAKRIEKTTFQQVIEQDLKVMDQTAFTLCKENDMPIMVFDMFVPGNMERAVRGEPIGTWVTAG